MVFAVMLPQKICIYIFNSYLVATHGYLASIWKLVELRIVTPYFAARTLALRKVGSIDVAIEQS
jgi:hypothetical protein